MADDGEVPELDAQAARSWIYPTNYPVRSYQLDITEQALARNTLVVLPTGLGKTLIASVVMYNYYRWFPHGLVVFMAPTKPLVQQQVEACFKVVGIPEEETALIDGGVKAAKRTKMWAQVRVVFCTPQTLDNDLQAGRVPAHRLTCLVVDEAHKATGSFAYCKIVSQLREVAQRGRRQAMRAPSGQHRRSFGFRLLALSATPGGDRARIQEVINNLGIVHIECRFDDDVDVQQYTHEKLVEEVRVHAPKGGASVKATLKKLFNALLSPVLHELQADNMLVSANPDGMNIVVFKEVRNKLNDRLSAAREVGGDMQLLMLHVSESSFRLELSLLLYKAKVACLDENRGGGDVRQAKRLLEEAIEFARARMQLGGDVNRRVPQDFLSSRDLGSLQAVLGQYLDGRSIDIVQAQPKINALKELLADHFVRCTVHAGTSTRAMVFCNSRDTVQEIVQQLQLMRQEARAAAQASVTAWSGGGSELGLASVPPSDVPGAAVVAARLT